MNESMYVVNSDKSVHQAVEDLHGTVQANQFGVLHSYNFTAIMQSKGIDFKTECQVLEICNPKKAKLVLEENIALSNALPCRISVYDNQGQTQISMIKPTYLLSQLSDSASLQTLSRDVEQSMTDIIDQAK